MGCRPIQLYHLLSFIHEKDPTPNLFTPPPSLTTPAFFWNFPPPFCHFGVCPILQLKLGVKLCCLKSSIMVIENFKFTCLNWLKNVLKSSTIIGGNLELTCLNWLTNVLKSSTTKSCLFTEQGTLEIKMKRTCKYHFIQKQPPKDRCTLRREPPILSLTFNHLLFVTRIIRCFLNKVYVKCIIKMLITKNRNKE